MQVTFRYIFLLAVLSLASCATYRFVEKIDKIAVADELWQKNAQIKEPYKFQFRGHEFEGLPNVYSPVIFPGANKQSDLDIKEGETFLEMGSGTGVFSVMAALTGAKRVVAIDINPDAVKNTMINARLHNVDDRVKVLLGDMFAPLDKTEQFDTIFFNIPFCHRNDKDKKLTMLAKSLFDPNHDLLYRYLKESRSHLKPNGRLLLGYSTTHGDISLMHKWAEEFGWKTKLLHKEGDETKDFITVELYEFRQ